MTYFFDELESGLCLSPRPECAEDVARSSCHAIINLCDFDPPTYVDLRSATETRIVRWPFRDEFPAPYPFLEVAVLELAALRKEDIRTLVHCRGGNSRSPTIIAIYWMARDNVSWEVARRRIQTTKNRFEPVLGELGALATQSMVYSIVNRTQEFLAGNSAILEHSRSTASVH